MAYICPADVLLDDMKRTLGANRICLPGSIEEKGSTRLIAAPDNRSGARNITESQLPDISKLGISGSNGMFRSRLNGATGSPRIEVQRLFGGEIAR
jgi:hypothetical protein